MAPVAQAPLRIRPARPDDIPAAYAMKRALAVAEGHEGVLRASEQDWRRDAFGPARRFRCIVAEAGATLVGMATYSEVYMTALAAPIFSIQDLYVAPESRRLGAGRGLVAEVAAVALERGIPLIELAVMDKNPARQFYRRLGFQHLEECLTYAVGGEPMLALAAARGRGAAGMKRKTSINH
jgi:ribosomal protein S18 acetylase RimI-like enzyme